jgi:cytochrome c-type biogenesis protein CcmH/NrfG
MLADAFVILAALLLASAALTQVLIPLFRGEPLFRSVRKSYQRERCLRQQLEQAKRDLARLELEKELAEHHNELLRRRMEQIDSYPGFISTAVKTDDQVVNRSNDTSEKER